MTLADLHAALAAQSIPVTDATHLGRASVIGYDKRFRWRWMATQLNTFVICTDYGDEAVAPAHLAEHAYRGFDYAREHYAGWPRGLQSGLAVMSVLLTTDVTPEASRYCRQLKAEKKWAGFAVPVCVDAGTDEVHAFEKAPLWGRVYYPYFGRLIASLRPPASPRASRAAPTPPPVPTAAPPSPPSPPTASA